MLSAPTNTAPAASSRSINVASRGAGGKSRLIFDPARVARPCTSNKFFTANGTPASGPGFLPAASAASTAAALTRARSAVTSVKELSTESYFAIRASAASVTPSAESFPPLTACAVSEAEAKSRPDAAVMSGCKDTGRLGFVGQCKLIHQPRQPHGHFEIGPDSGLPRNLDRQGQGFRDGIDVIIKRISSHCSYSSIARQDRYTGNGG